MITRYRGNGVRFYDITGYGHEGKIEGLTRDELRDLREELDDMIEDDVDISNSLERFDELIRSFKCGIGHGINCGCEGTKKRGTK